MSKEIKNKVVPKLRFPEFETEWKEKVVEDFFNVGSSKRVLEKDWSDKGIPFYRTRELVSLSKNEAFSNEIFISEELFNEFSEKYGLPSEGDFLVSGVGTLGILYEVKSSDKFYFKDGNVLWFKLKSGIVSSFFKYCFQSDIIQKQIFGQASISTVGTYTIQNAKKTKFYFPININEQQKIASCLSSLDDLITAENQKLEALKEHKKGLMQQLFPTEGETVPKLRFPEFRDSGEWEEKSIQELIDEKIIVGHLDGNHGALYPKAEEFSKEGIPYISANDFITGIIDFQKCKYLPKQRALLFKKGIAKSGDILFAHNATVGPVAKLITSYPFVILSTTATYFRCNNNLLINDFLIVTLSSPKFINQYSRVMSQSTRNQVPITTQRKFNLQLPKIEEQQKIASCLSSLDELITAQTEKIEALKEHKKGLMQGLFPGTV